MTAEHSAWTAGAGAAPVAFGAAPAAPLDATRAGRASGIVGAKATGRSLDAVMSADGRLIAFAALVSRGTGAAGAKGDAVSDNADVSADGRRGAFASDATKLSADDDAPATDVFVRDLDAATTTLASRGAGGATRQPPLARPGRVRRRGRVDHRRDQPERRRPRPPLRRLRPRARRGERPAATGSGLMLQPISRAAALAVLATLATAPASLARKPPAYPPAQLWYRVSVDFDGTWTGATLPDPAHSMFSEKWTLHSNTAVRVSLMCQNTLLPDGTLVFIRRRLRDGGRRVRVGGCPRNRPKGSHLRPTLRFAANATGEISEWEHSLIALGAGVCPDTPETQRLTSAQGIGGSISSPSSAVEGLVLRVRLAPPAGTMHNHRDARRCSYFSEPARDVDSPWRAGDPYDPVGDEFIADPQGLADGRPAWLPMNQLLISRDKLLTRQADRFGHAFTLRFTVDQAAIAAGSYPPAPPGTGGNEREKHYRYTFHFTPCPRRGLDVKHC